MHEVLQSICTELDQLSTQMLTSIPSDEPFNIAHNNWSFPGVSRQDLARETTSLANLIRNKGQDNLGENDQIIRDYPRRLAKTRELLPQNIWGNSAVGVPVYFSTLDSLRGALSTALKQTPEAELSTSLTRAASRVRGIEARLSEIEPRSEKLDVMVARIESAHSAADQLPTDLQTLEEARKK